MITPFGIAVRKIRLDKGLRLLDLSKKLGYSASFVSAVEVGKKPIPPNYVRAVAEALSVTDAEFRELQGAADRTKPVVDVEALPGAQREFVAAFARNIDELPAELVEQLKKRVYKSMVGDVPFKRKRKGMLVEPTSTKVLWDLADQVRSIFVNDDDICFPIMDVLEYKLSDIIDGYYLDICSPREMGSDEGRVLAGSKCIQLREDVYEGAWNGVGRDRFTACHEFGHFLMHRKVSMPRVRDDSHPMYRDAEWQADTFAGALLMSRSHLQRLNVQTAASRCGMTQMAASVMWSKYQKQ